MGSGGVYRRVSAVLPRGRVWLVKHTLYTEELESLSSLVDVNKISTRSHATRTRNVPYRAPAGQALWASALRVRTGGGGGLGGLQPRHTRAPRHQAERQKNGEQSRRVEEKTDLPRDFR